MTQLLHNTKANIKSWINKRYKMSFALDIGYLPVAYHNTYYNDLLQFYVLVFSCQSSFFLEFVK